MISREVVGKGIREVGREIYRERSLMGFYSGLGVRLAGISLISLVFFTVYENIKHRILNGRSATK